MLFDFTHAFRELGSSRNPWKMTPHSLATTASSLARSSRPGLPYSRDSQSRREPLPGSGTDGASPSRSTISRSVRGIVVGSQAKHKQDTMPTTDSDSTSGPIAQSNDPRNNTNADPNPLQPESSATRSEARLPLSVLLVDDSQVFLGTLRRLLESLDGIKVVGVATTGQDAIEFVRNVRPDVVLMDLTLPEMDGLQTSRQIATLPHKPMIIIMSVHDLPSYRKASLAAGADAFVAKSDLLNHFQPLVRDLLEQSDLDSTQLT